MSLESGSSKNSLNCEPTICIQSTEETSKTIFTPLTNTEGISSILHKSSSQEIFSQSKSKYINMKKKDTAKTLTLKQFLQEEVRHIYRVSPDTNPNTQLFHRRMALSFKNSEKIKYEPKKKTRRKPKSSE